MNYITPSQRQSVVDVALRAVNAHISGQSKITLGGQEFDLRTGGYCARFVRQCYEVALGLGEGDWQFSAGSALEMEQKLRAAGLGIPREKAQPGDIVAINRNSGQYGHIAIYIGGGWMAENTISVSRGIPTEAGTKKSPISAVDERITGFYSLCQQGKYNPSAIIVQSTEGKVLTRRGYLANGELWVPAREVLEALGHKVTDHLGDLGKVFVE